MSPSTGKRNSLVEFSEVSENSARNYSTNSWMNLYL